MSLETKISRSLTITLPLKYLIHAESLGIEYDRADITVLDEITLSPPQS